LLRRLRNGAGGVSHFIIDEAHERSMDCDILLCMLREIFQQHYNSTSGVPSTNDGPRLIVMSATVDIGRLSAYFAESGLTFHTMDVPGRMHSVDTYYLEDTLKRLGPEVAAAAVAQNPSSLPLGVWTETCENCQWDPGPESAVGFMPGTISAVRACDSRYIPLGVAKAIVRRHFSESFQTQHSGSTAKHGSVLFFLPGRQELGYENER
jgi:HrpA-like RNA helicase